MCVQVATSASSHTTSCHRFCSLWLLYMMILYTSTTVDLYPFFIGHCTLPLLPWFPSALPLFSPIVPSTPYPTTPVSGDRAPIRDSRPRHSQGHEACLSPPYVIHSLLSLSNTQSRLTRDWPTPSGIPSHVRTLVSPTAILSRDSTQDDTLISRI